MELWNFHFLWNSSFHPNDGYLNGCVLMCIGYGDGWFGQGVFWVNGTLELWLSLTIVTCLIQ